MTAEPDPTVSAGAEVPGDPPMAYLVGRLISLRFVATALRRRRKVWVGLAAVGLILGAGYHFVAPRAYDASATLYLAHLPGTDDTIDMANDMALLQTKVVGQAAVDRLGEPHLTATQLLGKAPGTADSDNVMTIRVSGPTKAEAVDRANALARAFLTFRAQQGRQQASASTAALQKQVNALNLQITQLTAQINSLNPATQGSQLTTLVLDKSADTSEVVSLEQTVQQADVNASTVADGSQLLTPAAADPSSTAKMLALDGVSGLAGGLALGVGLVTLVALFSDRVRRRDEISALTGVSVELSLPRSARRGRRRWRARTTAVRTSSENVKMLADYLYGRRKIVKGRSVLLVVAGDRTDIPAAALAAVAGRLTAGGKSVVVADLTRDRLLAAAVGRIHRARRAGESEDDEDLEEGEVFLLDPDLDGGDRDPTGGGKETVLALAKIDPGSGAWHLDWAAEAIVTFTAGSSSAQHVSATTELVRAAGVSIAAAVLLDADDDDETVGLVEAGPPVFGRPAQVVSNASTWQ
jgi:capsular polysaccharide biosynthesis protein